MSIDMTSSEAQQRNVTERSSTGLWRSLRALWCSHSEMFHTAKTDTMPAHVVCASCGWREPVLAAAPRGTRTWDSSRDEARYQREKKRRASVEEQLQNVVARRAAPGVADRRGRTRRTNVLEMKRVVGG